MDEGTCLLVVAGSYMQTGIPTYIHAKGAPKNEMGDAASHQPAGQGSIIRERDLELHSVDHLQFSSVIVDPALLF